MNDNYPQPTEPIRYRSAWMFVSAAGSFCCLSLGLFGLIIIFLGNNGSSTCLITPFLIIWLAIAGLGVISTAIALEATSDGLKVTYLFHKSRPIPWQKVHKVSIKGRYGQWWMIMHGERPFRKKALIVDLTYQHGQSKRRTMLINVIIINAQLKLADSHFFGSPIYRREEAIYD